MKNKYFLLIIVAWYGTYDFINISLNSYRLFKSKDAGKISKIQMKLFLAKCQDFMVEICLEKAPTILDPDAVIFFETNKNNFYNYIEKEAPFLKETFFIYGDLCIANIIKKKIISLGTWNSDFSDLNHYFHCVFFLEKISDKDMEKYKAQAKKLDNNPQEKQWLQLLEKTFILGGKTFRSNLTFLKKYYHGAYELIIEDDNKTHYYRYRCISIYQWQFSQKQWQSMNLILFKLKNLYGAMAQEEIYLDPEAPWPKIYKDEIHLFKYYIENYFYGITLNMMEYQNKKHRGFAFFIHEYMNIVDETYRSNKKGDLYKIQLYYNEGGGYFFDEREELLVFLKQCKNNKIITLQEEQWMSTYTNNLQYKKIIIRDKDIEQKYTIIKNKIIQSSYGAEFIKQTGNVENIYESNLKIFKTSGLIFQYYEKIYPIIANQWIEILTKRFKMVVDEELEDLLFLFIMAMLNENHHEFSGGIGAVMDDFLDYDSIPSWIVARTEFIKKKHPHWFCKKNTDPYKSNRYYYSDNKYPCQYLPLLVKKFLNMQGFTIEKSQYD